MCRGAKRKDAQNWPQICAFLLALYKMLLMRKVLMMEKVATMMITVTVKMMMMVRRRVTLPSRALMAVGKMPKQQLE